MVYKLQLRAKVTKIAAVGIVAAATFAGAAPAALAAAPQVVQAPSIVGSMKGGNTVTCDKGTWTDSPTTFAYEWYRGSGTFSTPQQITRPSSNPSFRLLPGDLFRTIKCKVHATNGTGTTIATSAGRRIWSVVAPIFQP